MLAGEEQQRIDPALPKGDSDGRELDGFGAGADDQPYVGETQSSP